VALKEGEQLTNVVKGKTFNWCIHHKVWVIHKPSKCHLGLPTANAAASTSNPGQLDNATTVLATALAALKVDESLIVAGVMKLNFYLIVCLFGYLAPSEFIFTIIVWVSCMLYFFLKEDNDSRTLKTTPLRVALKNQSRFLPRRKPKIMLRTSLTKRSDLIRQQ